MPENRRDNPDEVQDGGGVCISVCKYLIFLIPYLTQCLLMGMLTPKLLVGMVLVQAAIFVVYLIERLAEVNEHVCSLVAFVIQELFLHAALLLYAVMFSTKYGGMVIMKVLGFVSFALIFLSIVFRVIYVCKRQQKKRDRRDNQYQNRGEAHLTGGDQGQGPCPPPPRQPASNPDCGGKTSHPHPTAPSAPLASMESNDHQLEMSLGADGVRREPPPAYTEVDLNPMYTRV